MNIINREEISLIIGQEWLILIVVAIVILFGSKKLPELARSFGRAKGEFERGQREIEKELREAELKEASTKPKMNKEKLVKVAEGLGIKTEGKTEEELREEVSKQL